MDGRGVSGRSKSQPPRACCTKCVCTGVEQIDDEGNPSDGVLGEVSGVDVPGGWRQHGRTKTGQFSDSLLSLRW